MIGKIFKTAGEELIAEIRSIGAGQIIPDSFWWYGGGHLFEPSMDTLGQGRPVLKTALSMAPGHIGNGLVDIGFCREDLMDKLFPGLLAQGLGQQGIKGLGKVVVVGG